jgi:hypothetical protein
VPQQQRLYNCAVVCKAWQAAAAAATRDLQIVPHKYTAARQRFHTWLLKHSGNVKSLTFTRAGNSNSQHIEQVMLPLKQLSGLTSLWATNAALSDGESAVLPEPAQEFSRSISSGYNSLENGFAPFSSRGGGYIILDNGLFSHLTVAAAAAVAVQVP